MFFLYILYSMGAVHNILKYFVVFQMEREIYGHLLKMSLYNVKN